VLTKIIYNKLNKTSEDDGVFQPLFFRLGDEGDAASFSALLDAKPHIKSFDTIGSQLKELIKSLNPAITYSSEELDGRVTEHLAGKDPMEYGVWVYYPWNEKVVHLLDEKEFVFLRTNRNKYKITDEEEEVLSKKRVGVVGLSVGQSVSLTMAMERTFGELRIADFDDLEITNLNRLRSGVHNMGMLKTVVVAREIAEIDPFLKVTTFPEGLTRDNMDTFFTGGGKLDLVIDECDGLDMKILLRHKAKSLSIPVVMEASDRGTVDVERFDIEKDRPLLHGFIDHLDHTKIGDLTNEEKIPYIMPMLGIDTISKRLKASMVEIKQTVATWPQLASAVTLGGALCADVCRRILLNKYHESGRYFVDIEELIGDKEQKAEGVYDAVDMVYPELTREQMLNLVADSPSIPSQIDNEALARIAEAGIWAPSAANNQPWKLLSKGGCLYLFHDKSQSYSWTDKEDFIAQISLGAALENILIKAAELGFKAEHHLFPVGNDKQLIAAVGFTQAAGATANADLAAFIGTRCTNRKFGDNIALKPGVLDELKRSGEAIAGARLSLLTTPEQVNIFADIESAAERIRFMHPQSHSEFFGKELRWNDSGKEIIHEGLDIKTLELTVSEEMGIRVASDKGVVALLNEWKTGKAFEKQIRNAIRSASAVGLVTIPGFSPENVVNGGRAAERIWLNATRLRLSLQPMSAPLFLHTRMKYGDKTGATPEMISEINELFEKLCNLFPELTDRHGLFLFRLFNAGIPTARSLRKDIEKIYIAL